MRSGKRAARKYLAELCWQLAQDPTAEWIRPVQGALPEKKREEDCFVITKAAKQFSSPRLQPFGEPTPQQEAEFKRLAQQWRREVMHLSSTTARVRHPAYEKIIQMGPDILGLLLRELAERGGHWFTALERITGEDPVNARDSGSVVKMAKAWIEWGRQKGYIN